MKSVVTELNQTIVMVTHNEELAKSSNKILELNDGMLLN